MATTEKVNRKRGYRSSDDRYDNSRNRNTRYDGNYGNENYRQDNNRYDSKDLDDSFSNNNRRNRDYGYIDTDHQLDYNRRRQRYSFDDYRENNESQFNDDNQSSNQGNSQWEFRNDNNIHTYYGQGNNGYGSYSQQDADNSFSYNKKRKDNSETNGQHRGKGPRGYIRSDERIHEDINDRLSEHGEVDASEIEVAVKQGEVTLSGFVHEKRSKTVAEDIADGVSGVKNVENRLRVGKPSAFTGSDSSTEGSQNTGEGSTSRRKTVSSPMGNNYGSEKN